MNVQDLNVLINLAERARQAGLIKFEEFTIVGDAIKNAVSFLNEMAAPAKTEEVPMKPSKGGKSE